MPAARDDVDRQSEAEDVARGSPSGRDDARTGGPGGPRPPSASGGARARRRRDPRGRTPTPPASAAGRRPADVAQPERRRRPERDENAQQQRDVPAGRDVRAEAPARRSGLPSADCAFPSRGDAAALVGIPERQPAGRELASRELEPGNELPHRVRERRRGDLRVREVRGPGPDLRLDVLGEEQTRGDIPRREPDDRCREKKTGEAEPDLAPRHAGAVREPRRRPRRTRP